MKPLRQELSSVKCTRQTPTKVTHTYQLVDAKGNLIDDANFVIKDNAIVVRDGASLDFETSASQTLHVQVTDKAGASHVEDITISIKDANDAPTAIKLDGGSVSEAADPGTVVGKLYTADADKGDAHTYQLVDAKGNVIDDANFAIKDNVIVVRDGASLDFETSASQTLHVQVTDKVGASHVEDITINIEDANDAPTAIKIDGGSVSEAASGGTVVGKLYTADADKGDAHTYQLVDAKGNVIDDANFAIKDNVIVVRDGASLDFETSAPQTLHVQVTDKAGASHIEDITISVTDANDAPTAIKLDGGNVSEAADAGTVVGKLYTADADKGDAHTYQLVDAEGNVIDDANFVIKDNAIVVRDGASLDFESAASQTLHVQVTDQAGASHVEDITINVTDANDAPTAIKLDGGSVSEAAASGTVVGKLYTADADKGDAHTYQLADAEGNVIDDGNFVIKDNSIVVRDGASLDFETSASQTLHVQVSDKAGATQIEDITIRIEDANDAPTAIKLDGGIVSETAEAGTVVGKLYTADADKGDTHTYQLVDAKGNLIDDANFVIKDNAIVVRDGASLDFETSASQTLHVQVTDKAGASHVEDITINIEDANEAPTAIRLDGGSVSEAADPGTVVGKLYTADADKSDVHTYQLVDAKGDLIDDANFVIKDNAIVVRDGASLDFETSASQTLHVQVTDKVGASHVEDITINIEDANDAPTAIKIDGGSVSEAASGGTVVGKLYTADADKGDAHTYQLVDVRGNAVDDANFVIKDNTIVVRDGASLDFETSASQTLHVQVTDKAGATHIEDITINIEDANDAPTAIKLDGGSVSEAADAGTVVGKLYTADADKGDSHTYRLIDARGNAVDDANFVIKDNVIVVRDGASLDFETSASQTLHVQVTDKAGASHVEDISIRIEDANDAPTALEDRLTTKEDGSIVVRLHGTDIDAGDQIEQIRIDTLPLHGQLRLDNRILAVGDEISASDAGDDRLVFVPDKDWSGDTYMSFSVSDGERWSEHSASVTLHVEAVADGALLTTEPARGLAGESVLLQIDALKQNQNGGERLTIRISGLPDGAGLSAGIRQVDGSWLLESANLSSLMLVLPPGQSQEFDLNVTAITTEENGSSASTSALLHVTVDTPVAVVSPVMPATSVYVPPESELANREDSSEGESGGNFEDLLPKTSGSDSGIPLRETFDDVKPVGDMVVLFRNTSIDWSTTEFGEVQPIASPGFQEIDTNQSEFTGIVDGEQELPPPSAQSVNVPASVSGFVWMWSAVRAMTGMRDERRGR
ncbi:MAG: Ig-like domain-containing protein [Planctomycetaceae bacterium]